MINKHWKQLESECPIDISRIISYAREMESNLPNRINLSNLGKCKESVLIAKGNLESLMGVLISILYDHTENSIYKPQDKLLYSVLCSNLARLLRRMDDDAFNYIVKLDEPDGKGSVGIGRIASFSQTLGTILDAVVYETLLKSVSDFKKWGESESFPKDKRTFLYLFYTNFRITMSVIGGVEREKPNKASSFFNKSSVPMNPKFMMSEKGGTALKNAYKEETGDNAEDLLDDSIEFLSDEFEEDSDETETDESEESEEEDA